ncbi:hypothetical protein C4546_03885 [Candidatus Parcubacteria bacterium]|jgi:hypothetical protein|nr:MAG: hypothetical protein C4546_03885 [Candidatus Parcubacteria bacterium]
MFLSPNLKVTKLKHSIYLLATTILGGLLSLLAHAGIEAWYLNWSEQNQRVVTWYGGCALPPALQIGLILLGLAGGFWLGRFWWKMVYIEKHWAKK